MASGVDLGGIYTLTDLLRMIAPDNGQLLFVAQVLSRKNPIVRDVPILEANQALTHVGSRTNALPTVYKRALNDGVLKSAHKEVPVTAPMSLFEAMSFIDEEILNLAGSNKENVRQRKDAAFIEAMSQSVADEIFYGSVGDDVLGFNGLSTIFGLSTKYPNNDSSWYYNVQLQGGSGSDTTSIWAIEWGPEKCHLIYPKGTMAGIEVNDKGLQLVDGVTSYTKYWAWVTQFKWRCGLFVADERCVQRIANIETSGSDYTFDEDKLIAALERLPGGGNDPMTRIYCNRTIKTQMRIKLKDKNNVHFTRDQGLGGGGPVLKFDDVPIETCDAILNTETAIS